MNRLRLADVKEPIARVLNMNATDARVRTYVNEAHARLVAKGKFVGTVQRYRFCASSQNCVTLPRQIETIEAWQLCTSPGVVRNQWYEFNGQGPGLLKETSNWFTTIVDRGTAATFDDITGTTKKLQVQAAVNESAGLRILLQGYDENGNWIRTLDGATWVDGEYVTISTTLQTTTNYFTVLTGAVKPATNGSVRIFEYNVTTSAIVKTLAIYENDELVPIYRRYMIPGLENMSGCGDDDADCSENKQVTLMVKLRHIDVVNDADYLLLGNIGAMKLMVQAILKEERNLPNEAMIYEANATRLLQDELSSYEGDGALPTVRTEGRETWGAGVENVVGYNFYRGY